MANNFFSLVFGGLISRNFKKARKDEKIGYNTFIGAYGRYCMYAGSIEREIVIQ